MNSAHKLSWAAQHLHLESNMVWCSIGPDLLENFEEVPEELLGHTRLLLAGLKSHDQVIKFDVFTNRLTSIWEQAKKQCLQKKIYFVLGQGLPSIPGLEIRPPIPGHNQACTVSFSAPVALVKKWHIGGLIAAINDRLQSWNIDQVNEAQVVTMWFRAVKHHQKIVNYPLSCRSQYSPTRKGRTHWVRLYEERPEIEILIGDLKKLSKEELLRAIMMDIEKIIDRLAISRQNTGVFRILGKTLQKRIALAYNGPQWLDLGLPLSVAGAFCLPFPQMEGVDPILPALCLKAAKPQRILKHLGKTLSSEDWSKCQADLVSKGLFTSQMTKEPGVKFRGFLDLRSEASNYALAALSLGEKALKVNKAERDIEALTLCLNEEKAHRFFQIIQEFKLKNLDELCSPGSDLWQLNFQAFPLTRLYPKKHDKELIREQKPWCSLVLREMVLFPTFNENCDWIAQRLYPSVSPAEIQQCLSRLEAAKFLQRNSQGRLVQSSKSLVIDESGGRSMLDYHRSALQLAMQSRNWDIKERSECFAITFASSSQRIEDLREAIRSLLKNLFEQEKHVVAPDQIYQVGYQLFPLA